MTKNINELVGQRIRDLRNERGISQEELARRLGISRATLVDMEAGRRSLNVPEAQTLSEVFGLSMSDIMSAAPQITLHIEKEPTKKQKDSAPSMRISVPQKKINKFQEVLLYILGKVGAKANVGETVIYKLLYFIDFDYYEKFEEQLAGVTYIKNRYGPSPIEFKTVVDSMIRCGDVVRVEDKYFKYPQRKYMPRREADLTLLSAREIKHIDGVLDRLSGMSANEISEYSHKDVPWITAEEGKPIDYETVFYRTPEYSVRTYSEDDEA
ncbi:MAG: type II toxin-antitoxin system antitoxin SocA domain-containing protein [bacterium]